MKAAGIFRTSRMSQTSIAKGLRTAVVETAGAEATEAEIAAVAEDVPVVAAVVVDGVAAAVDEVGMAAVTADMVAAEADTKFCFADD